MGVCVSGHQQAADAAGAEAETVTLYGATWCHWSRKQLQALSAAGVPHVVVWCDVCGVDDGSGVGGTCAARCTDVDRFPVMELPGGKRMIGFHEAALVQTELRKIRPPT